MDYETSDREYVNSANLFRGAYGFVAFLYLFPQIALYSTLYVHCFKELSLRTPYGVLLCWNMFKVAVLGLVMFCAVQRRLSLGFGLLFGAAAILVAVGSLALLLLMIIDSSSIANKPGTRFDHPSHDPLYCCVFYNDTPGCEAKGPCANVNVTNTSFPLGESGDIFPLVERKHLKLNSNFKLGIGFVAVCLLLETVIVGFFFAILKTINSGSGLFVPAYPKPSSRRHKLKPPPHQGHPQLSATRYPGGQYEKIGSRSFVPSGMQARPRRDKERKDCYSNQLDPTSEEEGDNMKGQHGGNLYEETDYDRTSSSSSNAWSEVRRAAEQLIGGCPKIIAGGFLWAGLILLGAYKTTMKCVTYLWRSGCGALASILSEPPRPGRHRRRSNHRSEEFHTFDQRNGEGEVSTRFGGRQSAFFHEF